jgi:hypothetical protein
MEAIMADPRKAIFDFLRPYLKEGWNHPDLVVGFHQQLDLLGARKEGPESAPPTYRLGDSAAFFAELHKSLFPAMDQLQVDGINAMLEAMGKAGWGPGWAAYGLATPYWETNKKMQPVEEAYYLEGKVRDLDAWRKANLRYYPWYGRGLVQTTWDYNYKDADVKLNLNGALVANPGLMLTMPVAVPALVRGMQEGWYTKVKLGDKIPQGGLGTLPQFKDARTIINGHDKDTDIAAIALKFQDALVAGKWAPAS